METKIGRSDIVISAARRGATRLRAQDTTRAFLGAFRAFPIGKLLAPLLSLIIGAPALAAPAIVSAGKPVTITTNGVWEAGGYSPADVTNGSLSCVDLASSSTDGTVGWQNNDYNELGIVNVTIDLSNTYAISSIDYNMGNCMRAGTWGADSITTPLGTFSPSPGSDSAGTWTSQTAVSQVVASTVTMQLRKTRTSWDRDWLAIGEIRIWGEPAQLPEPGPEPGPEAGPEPVPEPSFDGGVDLAIDSSAIEVAATTSTATSTVTSTSTSTATSTVVGAESSPDAGLVGSTDVVLAVDVSVEAASDSRRAEDVPWVTDAAVVTSPVDASIITGLADGGLDTTDAIANTIDGKTDQKDGGRATSVDASASDGSVTAKSSSSGCGCVLGSSSGNASQAWLILMATAAIFRRPLRRWARGRSTKE